MMSHEDVKVDWDAVGKAGAHYEKARSMMVAVPVPIPLPVSFQHLNAVTVFVREGCHRSRASSCFSILVKAESARASPGLISMKLVPNFLGNPRG